MCLPQLSASQSGGHVGLHPCNVIEPIWEARFIHYNSACRSELAALSHDSTPGYGYDYLRLAQQRGLGVYEKGDPWNRGYVSIDYRPVEI